MSARSREYATTSQLASSSRRRERQQFRPCENPAPEAARPRLALLNFGRASDPKYLMKEHSRASGKPVPIFHGSSHHLHNQDFNATTGRLEIYPRIVSDDPWFLFLLN
jgi:hypothetical protein